MTALHLYELGDLDDFFWPRTTWYALADAAGDVQSLALLYAGADSPTLVLLGRDAERPRALLEAITPLLPPRLEAHLVPGIVGALAGDFVVASRGIHERWVLVERERVEKVDTSSACALHLDDRDTILALYREAYADNWFDARMLETGMYFCVRRGQELVSIAGVHVVSRSYGAAALGNVATHPCARGEGLGRVVTAAVCKALAPIDPIGLNVDSTNAPARALYRSLGFERVACYEEVSLHRRD